VSERANHKQRRTQRWVTGLALLFSTLLTSCGSTGWAKDLHGGAAFSAVPNLGVSLAAGQTFDRNSERTWTFEFEGTFQPWDDEDLSDDGNVHSGDVTQIQMGVKRTSDPLDWRHWTQRYGAGWLRARGEPNVIQQPGDYELLYAGFGFETHLTKSITMGPELSLMIAQREKQSSIDFIPQFNWHITWGF